MNPIKNYTLLPLDNANQSALFLVEPGRYYGVKIYGATAGGVSPADWDGEVPVVMQPETLGGVDYIPLGEQPWEEGEIREHGYLAITDAIEVHMPSATNMNLKVALVPIRGL